MSSTFRARKLNVCFVTKEFHGLFRNGGIGTANTNLAFALVDAGFDVTVALADADKLGPRLKVGNFLELRDHYRGRGIILDYVSVDETLPNAFDDPRGASYRVFRYVSQGDFDVVLFNDNGALGYYSLLAKQTGVLRAAPIMIVVAHGPFDWVHELNSLEYYSRLPVMVGFMERHSARMADILISPSRYMIEWMLGRGWEIPENTRVIQNLVTLSTSSTRGPTSTRRPFREIVFFGRLEVRKGVELFCDAIDILQEAISLDDVTITCLGKFTKVAGIHAGVYMVERAQAWQASLRMRSQYDQPEALAYLEESGALAVMPSPAENSPCVVSECLQLGIPFLATATGGTTELVAPQDRAMCLFPPEPKALAERLRSVLLYGHDLARPSVSQEAARQEWLQLVEECCNQRDLQLQANCFPSAGRPRVSVCLAATAQFSQLCLPSIQQLTYSNLEILLLCQPDDLALQSDFAHSAGGSAQTPPVRIIVSSAHSLGCARNEVARHAQGEFILFMDEKSVRLLPSCIEQLVAAAAKTGAEVLTCFPEFSAEFRRSRPIDERFPIGSCTALGILENCFGNGVMFLNSKKFKAGPGFSEDCNDEVIDWQYLASASLRGDNLTVVPSHLYARIEMDITLDPGHIVAHHRQIIKAYEMEPARSLRYIIELLLDIPRRTRERTEYVLVGMSHVTSDLVRRLSMLDPGGATANQAFYEYLCEKNMIATATDFADHTGCCEILEHSS